MYVAQQLDLHKAHIWEKHIVRVYYALWCTDEHKPLFKFITLNNNKKRAFIIPIKTQIRRESVVNERREQVCSKSDNLWPHVLCVVLSEMLWILWLVGLCRSCRCRAEPHTIPITHAQGAARAWMGFWTGFAHVNNTPHPNKHNAQHTLSHSHCLIACLAMCTRQSCQQRANASSARTVRALLSDSIVGRPTAVCRQQQSQRAAHQVGGGRGNDDIASQKCVESDDDEWRPGGGCCWRRHNNTPPIIRPTLNTRDTLLWQCEQRTRPQTFKSCAAANWHRHVEIRLLLTTRSRSQTNARWCAVLAPVRRRPPLDVRPGVPGAGWVARVKTV